MPIALFGEVLADIFPNATVLGGAPYNVARHLQAFQQQALLISRVGHDALKDALFHELDKLAIDASHIQLDSAYPTGQVIVHIEGDTHHFDIALDQAYDHIQTKALATQPQLIYFGTLAQRSTQSRLALNALLHAADCPRFLDINLRNPWYNKAIIQHSLMEADIVKVNEEELRIVSALFDSSCSNDQARALLLIKQFKLQHLLVTCGDRGAWALSSEGQPVNTKVQSLDAAFVDSVGAGDAFAAVYILGLLHHWPMQTRLSRANTFASAICTIKGAAPETADFYFPYISRWL